MEDDCNLYIYLTKRPGVTYPEINDIYQIKYCANPEEQNVKVGQIIVQNLFISIDAAMRVWISGAKTYMDPVNPGDVMPAACVGRVLFSRSSKFDEGDYVYGLMSWQKYLLLEDKSLQKLGAKNSNLSELDLLNALGAYGISGMTAYTGFENIGNMNYSNRQVGKPKEGEIVVISAASGAVGEIAVQLAKHYYKCKVIGIAGDEQKCDYVKLIGADYCINYKKDNIGQKLRELCPDGVDIYFDNVGGEILDDVLMNIKNNSRIILCGFISQYNKEKNNLYRMRNYSRLILKKALMQGFIYTDYAHQFKDGIAILKGLTENNKLKVRYDIQNGLDEAPKGLQKLLQGRNQGKVIVRVQRTAPTPKL